MMNDSPKTRGPWHHRALIWFFSGLLGLLAYWLLGFVVNDIGTLPGPDYREIESRLVTPGLAAQVETLTRQLEDTTRTITEEKARQAVLRDSTDNSARTMNQLLEIQRLNSQRGVTASETEKAALRDAQQLFLTTQKSYQESNDRTAALTEQLRNLETQLRDANRTLETQRGPVNAEYARLASRHQLKLAALKLSVLVPVLVVVVVLFLRRRGSLYAPAVYALGAATLLKVLLVMHAHFPRFYFKYVLIGTSLALVARILVYLIRAAAFPKRDWILRQYREAYEHHFCPICNHPIRRGPLRFAYWTRRSLKRLSIPAGAGNEAEKPYVCPVCATQLFELCPACQGIRHTLLPACAHCGAEKPIAGT